MRPMGTFLALPISPIGRIGLISLISSIFERPYGRVSFSIPVVTGGAYECGGLMSVGRLMSVGGLCVWGVKVVGKKRPRKLLCVVALKVFVLFYYKSSPDSPPTVLTP